MSKRLLMLLFCAACAHASVILTVTNPVQSTPIPGTLSFSGTIQNTDAIDFQYQGTVCTGDCSLISGGITGVLLTLPLADFGFMVPAGTSLTHELFVLEVGSTASPFSHKTADIAVVDFGTGQQSNFATIDVTAGAVPEPSSVVLLTAGIVALILKRRQSA